MDRLAAEGANLDRATLPAIWWIGPIAAVIALIFAYYFYRQVMRKSEGTEAMVDIAQAIREGATAYLSRQYRVVAIVFGILFLIFLILSFSICKIRWFQLPSSPGDSFLPFVDSSE